MPAQNFAYVYAREAEKVGRNDLGHMGLYRIGVGKVQVRASPTFEVPTRLFFASRPYTYAKFWAGTGLSLESAWKLGDREHLEKDNPLNNFTGGRGWE